MNISEIPPVTLSGAGAFLYRACQDEEVLFVGAAGTGKTIAAMKKLVDVCYAYPGSRHLLCRQTRKSMTDSTLPTLESVIGDSHPEVTRVSREQRHSYRLWGSEIVCAGLDEPSKAYGTAWGLVVLDEAIEAELGAWELFARSARDPKLRVAGKGRSFPYFQRIAITNPGSPDHWLNQRATAVDETLLSIDSREDYRRTYRYSVGPQVGKMRRLLAVHQDNPTLFDQNQWLWTPEGEKYLGSLDAMSGHRRAWMRLGLWRQPSGVVFPEFDSSIHIVDDFEPPAEWPQIIAYDPGYGTTAVLWICKAPDGAIIVFDGIYEGGKSVEKHCNEINRRNEEFGRNVLRCYGDPNEMFSDRSQGVSCAAQAMKYGLRFLRWPADKGAEFDAGVELVRSTLENALKPEPIAPYLQICRRVKGLINNFGSWSFKKKRTGEVPDGADKYEEANDHALDCLRGALSSGFLQRYEPE